MTTLRDLEAIAFPENHLFSVKDLRKFAYAKKLNEPTDNSLSEHTETCKFCQEMLKSLTITDPFLNGENEKIKKVTIDVL